MKKALTTSQRKRQESKRLQREHDRLKYGDTVLFFIEEDGKLVGNPYYQTEPEVLVEKKKEPFWTR
jgi:hypothetical protein